LGETRDITVSYNVVDNEGGSVAQTATITITGTNDAPTNTGGIAGFSQGGGGFRLPGFRGNDVDSDDTGDTLIYTITGGPTVDNEPVEDNVFITSSPVVQLDQVLRLEASLAFRELSLGELRPVVVEVTATDRHGATASADFTFSQFGENDDPTLGAGALAAVEDGPAVSLDLSALGDDIDNDDDGSSLIYTVADQPSEGSVTISGTTLTFDPGAAVTNTVTVTVTGTNDAPFIPEGQSLDLGTVSEGSTTAFNDLFLVDVDGPDQVSIASISADFGTAVQTTGPVNFEFTAPDVGPDGQEVTITIDYTDGEDITSVQRTVFVTNGNSAPVINGNTVLSPVNEDTSRIISIFELLANVSDADGDALTALGLSIASGDGLLEDNGDGTFTFTPIANDDTEVTFDYEVSDGQVSTTGTATLDILPVNDDPTVVSALTATASEDDAAFSIDLLDGASDVDADAVLSVADVTGLVDGLTLNGTTLSVDPSNAAFPLWAKPETLRFPTMSSMTTVEVSNRPQRSRSPVRIMMPRQWVRHCLLRPMKTIRPSLSTYSMVRAMWIMERFSASRMSPVLLKG